MLESLCEKEMKEEGVSTLPLGKEWDSGWKKSFKVGVTGCVTGRFLGADLPFSRWLFCLILVSSVN